MKVLTSLSDEDWLRLKLELSDDAFTSVFFWPDRTELFYVPVCSNILESFYINGEPYVTLVANIMYATSNNKSFPHRWYNVGTPNGIISIDYVRYRQILDKGVYEPTERELNWP